jgi:hypothetical protein
MIAAGPPGDAHLARLPQRPAPLFCEELADAVRHGDGAADEHRAPRRSRRRSRRPAATATVKGIPTDRPRSSSVPTTSTAAPPRSSASRRRGLPRGTSARSPRASGSCRSATSTRYGGHHPETCAFLFEPIQCEAGINIPRTASCARRSSCRGTTTCCDRRRDPDRARTDRRASRATTRGVSPISTSSARRSPAGSIPCPRWSGRRGSWSCSSPGIHGSTYGGNPLGCAVREHGARRDAGRGAGPALGGARCVAARDMRAEIRHPSVREIRGRGLLIGIELDVAARPFCEALQERGVLCKETHDLSSGSRRRSWSSARTWSSPSSRSARCSPKCRSVRRGG